MKKLISELIIYRELPDGDILYRMADICERLAEDDKENLISDLYSCIHSLLDIATRYGFDGNLWQNYLTYLLVMTETPFTLVCEKEGAKEGSVNRLALSDLKIFRELFEYDFGKIEEVLGIDSMSVICDYHALVKKERIYNKEVSEKVRFLCDRLTGTANAQEMFDVITEFYRDFGVGKLGMNKAFRISEDTDKEFLIPITTTMDVTLDDLVGYDAQKQKLISNTEAFVSGRKANNVLLYGDAGTGKSTSIKAILNQYYDRGLRMIEIYKHQFRELSRVISEVKNRNYKFIIYMDDLSFEEFETDYKYLKAVIEGGLEVRPDNVLIYATSNRRHLIRETWSDKRDADPDDIHHNDTIQEKLSLASRFGISIGYFRPNPDQFKKIVTELAARHGELKLSEEELLKKANIWEMSHGGLSGRVAQQFIDDLLAQNI
ncbi:MAG: ATP-binding protein [Lachnospiraceae bacterium]|nr:ATP-binding protein [Lachnospiraceae bacterium]